MSKSFLKKALLGGAVAAGAAVWAIAPRSFSDKRRHYVPAVPGALRAREYRTPHADTRRLAGRSRRSQWARSGDRAANPNHLRAKK